jgi:hypothetical protein
LVNKRTDRPRLLPGILLCSENENLHTASALPTLEDQLRRLLVQLVPSELMLVPFRRQLLCSRPVARLVSLMGPIEALLHGVALRDGLVSQIGDACIAVCARCPLVGRRLVGLLLVRRLGIGLLVGRLLVGDVLQRLLVASPGLGWLSV